MMPPSVIPSVAAVSPKNRCEQRWGARVVVNIPVQVSAAPVLDVRGTIKNLSLSGAFLQLSSDCNLHALIAVRIELPAPMQRVAVVKAHISRKSPDGIGIEWCEFAPDIVKDILRSPTATFPL